MDVEATCWRGASPEGEQSEIIEIGLTEVDLASARLAGTRSWLIRPTVSMISDFCTELTTITPDELRSDGLAFGSVLDQLVSQCDTRNRLWVSWGDYDRGMFEKQCAREQVAYPFGKRHLNLKTLFSVLYGLDRELGMAEALDYLKLPLVGTHHRAGADSENIGVILAHSLKTFRLGNLARSAGE